MAITLLDHLGGVYTVGNTFETGSGTVVATRTPTTTIPVGSRIIITSVCQPNATGHITAISDTQGNTYNNDVTYRSDVGHAVWSANVDTALTTSDTISITVPKSGNNTSLVANAWSGIKSTSYLGNSTISSSGTAVVTCTNHSLLYSILLDYVGASTVRSSTLAEDISSVYGYNVYDIATNDGDVTVSTSSVAAYFIVSQEYLAAPSEPSAPSAPSLTVVDPTHINISIPALSGAATSYNLERAPDSSGSPGSYVVLGTAVTPSSTYNDSGLTPGAKYWYRLNAVNGSGNTEGSAASLTETPAAPGQLTVTVVSSTAVHVTIPALSGGAASYNLQRAPDVSGSPGSYATISTGTSPSSTYNDSGLTTLNTYHYRLVAVDGSGSTNGADKSIRVFFAVTLQAVSSTKGAYTNLAIDPTASVYILNPDGNYQLTIDGCNIIDVSAGAVTKTLMFDAIGGSRTNSYDTHGYLVSSIFTPATQISDSPSLTAVTGVITGMEATIGSYINQILDSNGSTYSLNPSGTYKIVLDGGNIVDLNAGAVTNTITYHSIGGSRKNTYDTHGYLVASIFTVLGATNTP